MKVGWAWVYKALDIRLDRPVVLKVLPADKVTDAERKRRFVQEAKAASALNHPNIITIYDIDQDGGVDFIAMEHVAGRSLEDRISRHGLRVPEVLRYGVQIADALAAAHASGIIHRDLKPGNIMVADSGLVKVLDFGIAKLTKNRDVRAEQPTKSAATPGTGEGSILGTIAYMSPEQAQRLKIDTRSDIFSLGAVTYEMLTGRRAFSGETTMSTLSAILTREPQPLDSTIPRELDRIVARCLRKDPARRFQTMADLKVALEELKFDSTGPPQGIYEVSAFGGDPRLVAADSTGPSVSPDGASVAYFGRPSLQPFVVSTSGGDARPIAAGFSILNSGKPVWFPDSQRVAISAQKTGQPSTREWWAAHVSGRTDQPLNWARWAGEHRYFGSPQVPIADAGIATLYRRAGEMVQIYRVRTRPAEGDAAWGEPISLTGGTGWSANPSITNEKIAFQSGIPETALWTLPADTNAGRVIGSLERITTEKAVVGYASTTADGKTVVFGSNRTGSMDVILRDLLSGQERVLTSDAPDQSKTYALIDIDGSMVLYAVNAPKPDDAGSHDVYVIPARGGVKRKICDACGPTMSLSPDRQYFLAHRDAGVGSHVAVVDVASGTSTPLLKTVSGAINAARFSPDGNWIVFTVTRAFASIDVMIAPFRGRTIIPESDWVTVTPTPGDTYHVFWSPNGGLVYYDLSTAGSSALMARRLDSSHHPIGDAFRVYEFAGRARLAQRGPPPDTLSAVPGRFVGVLAEINYNIG